MWAILYFGCCFNKGFAQVCRACRVPAQGCVSVAWFTLSSGRKSVVNPRPYLLPLWHILGKREKWSNCYVNLQTLSKFKNPNSVLTNLISIYLFIYFFLIYLFIYFIFLFIFGCVGSSVRARAFSSCGKRGPLFIAVRGPLFIAVRGPLSIAAPPAAGHRLQTRRLSNRGSRAQPLRGMWDLPRPGLEPASPALAGRLSTTAPPGKPHLFFINGYLYEEIIFNM